LKVDKNAVEEIKVDSSNSNQVVVLSQVETNIQHFNPCGYDTITALLDTKEYPIFQRKTSEIKSELTLKIITNDKTKQLFIYLPDLNTTECTYNNAIEYHTGKVISLKNPEAHYKNLKKSNEDISFDISYPRPTSEQIIDYAWLPNAKPIRYGLQFETCRFQHPLTIEVFPELEYTFNAHLGVKESEYLYVTQTKNYKRRDYEGKKKNGTKAAKRDHNKRVKENFKDDVDNQVKKDNFREKYKVSVGAEYKFGEEEPTVVEFALLKTLEDVIENIMYVYDTIDSYLQGDQMKQVEQGEEFDEAGNKKNLTPAQKAKNRAEYKAKKNQRQAKKKKSMPKAAGFPVRLEVTPPKFTGGVTWGYKQSQKEPNLIGVNYQFKFGALPLVGVTGRLDLLFVAQFIPYVGQVVNERENKNRFAAIYFFCALLVFTLFPFFISYNLAMAFTVASWLPNYIYSYSIKDKKVLDSLKGNTVSFIFFWVALLVISIIISISGHSFGTDSLPKKYNYGYLINLLYNLFFILSVYNSNRYRNISV